MICFPLKLRKKNTKKKIGIIKSLLAVVTHKTAFVSIKSTKCGDGQKEGGKETEFSNDRRKQ